MNKIGVILESFHTDINSAVNHAIASGADAVQFYAVGGDLDCGKLTLSQQQSFSDLLHAKNLEISAICADTGGHGFQIQSENAVKIAKTVRVMEWARTSACRTVTSHIGVISAFDSPERRIITEACKKINNAAEKLDVYFAVETGPESIATLNGFLTEIDCHYICVNYDPANIAMVTGGDPISGVYTLGNRIVHTHAKNGIMKKLVDPKVIYDYFADGGIGDFRLSDYFEETSLMHGDVNIPLWLRALKEIGYAGYLTIERETMKNPIEEINGCVQFLRQEQKKLWLN